LLFICTLTIGPDPAAFSVSAVTFLTTRLYNQIKSSPKSFLCERAPFLDPKTEGSVILETSMY